MMEYSNTFQDNISSNVFDSTSKNILDWVKENREKFDWAKDPNAYEMVNLFLFGAKYSNEKINIDIDTLKELWEIRSKDFERCNISSDSFVYRICEDSLNSSISKKPLVNDENSHHALRKIAGIGLFLKQQQRENGKVEYNNPQELIQLLECSKTLKTFHPDLYTKYKMENNLEVLCDLQLEHDLPNDTISIIQEMQGQLSHETPIENSSRLQKDDYEREN